MSAITLIKGDDTDWNGQQTFVININTTLDLSEGFSAVFTIGDITKEFDFIQDNKIYPILTNKETSTLPLGYINGVLKIYDAEKRIRTIKSNIPFNVRAGVYTSNADINADGETIPTEQIDIDVDNANIVDYNSLVHKPTLNNFELQGSVTLQDIGLGNIDNTSDLEKPISNATQQALNNIDTKIQANSNDITNIKGDIVDLNASIETKQDAGDYALKSDIPTKLPNPNSLIIKYNNVEVFSYDGSSQEAGNFIVNGNTIPVSDSEEKTINELINEKANQQEVTSLIQEFETIQQDLEDLGNTVNENSSNISSHVSNKNNPHEVTKTQIGLENVDNTSDLDKPISNATQSALDLKANSSDLSNYLTTSNAQNTYALKTDIENKVSSIQVTNILQITEEEFNSLEQKDANTLYLII